MADLERVAMLAETLIHQHLAGRPGEEWSFGFDRAKRRAGLCDYRDRRITVSRYLAKKFTMEQARQVILHEIAHALAGARAGHGASWRATARSIGYTGGRTHQGEIAHEFAPWVGRCPNGHQHYRFRVPSRATSCALCARGFSPAHEIRWEHRRPPARDS